MSIREAEADLARFEARAEELRAESASVAAEIQRLRDFLDTAKRYGLYPEPDSNESNIPPSDELTRLFRGKSIPDAAIVLLDRVGRPLSEDEIVDGLRRGGVTFVSEKPALTLRFALLRKRKETAGLIDIESGHIWHLTAPVPEEPDAKSGFVHNRDRNDHAERSRRGLQAARERGVVNGRRSVMTPEMRATAEALISDGASVAEVADKLGVANVTVYKWMKKGILPSHKAHSHPKNDAEAAAG